MTTIAFIGLGNMGGPMAANLVKAGHTVTGFDLSDASKSAARHAGVRWIEGSFSRSPLMNPPSFQRERMNWSARSMLACGAGVPSASAIR